MTSTTDADSYADRRSLYRRQKKEVTQQLMSTLADPTVVVLQDWLKVRGKLKGWTRIWCELRPGVLLLFKTPKTVKSGHWIGTVILNVCQVIERPSKKNGFCFKLFNPLDQSIWASKGPRGESIGSLTLPLPASYLIFRTSSIEAGKTWMDALELSLRCSSLLTKAMSTPKSGTLASLQREHSLDSQGGTPPHSAPPVGDQTTPHLVVNNLMNDSEIERHFGAIDDDVHTDVESSADKNKSCDEDNTEPKHKRGDTTHVFGDSTDSDSVFELNSDRSDGNSGINRHGTLVPKFSNTTIDGSLNVQSPSGDLPIVETDYSQDSQNAEEFGPLGDPSAQTEEMAEENKSLLWCLLKQVRPGMDLSKVVLPTFILEKRSFLEKITDYYYHANILTEAGVMEDPLERMKGVVKWYLSGFYKKPKGLKKPYNPILGESFRCYWLHPNSSRTFYIAEQVSHHPPISAFYVTNRKDGFCISGSILAKSKFYGNSVSAILDGTAKLTFLNRGETYAITMPYAHCKGILMGTLTMELGGKVEIICDKTGYRTELEFRLKPFIGGNDYINSVVGKIKLGKETMGTIDGHWDRTITYHDRKGNTDSSGSADMVLWEASSEIRLCRLPRFTVHPESQGEYESQRLWTQVTAAIDAGDQVAATVEKTKLEEAQRRAAKDRLLRQEPVMTKYFNQDPLTGEWVYRYADNRPWDERTDILQFEHDYIIQTKTKHKQSANMMKTSSVYLNGGNTAGNDGQQSMPPIMLRPPSGGPSSGSSAAGKPIADYAIKMIGRGGSSKRHYIKQNNSESCASDEGEGSSDREGRHSSSMSPHPTSQNPSTKESPRDQKRDGNSLTPNSQRYLSDIRHVLKELVQQQERTQSQITLLSSQIQSMRQTVSCAISTSSHSPSTSAATTVDRWATLKMNFIVVLLVIFAQFVINFILVKK